MPFTAIRISRPAVAYPNNAGILRTPGGRPSGSPPPSPVPEDPVVSLAAEAQRQLPLRKLAVFARKYTNGDIVSQLPLYGYADLTLSIAHSATQTPSMAHSGSLAWKHECRLPLGELATDHVGYASFDLSLIADLQTLISIVADAPKGMSPADLDVAKEGSHEYDLRPRSPERIWYRNS
jgi:hypothetical protein